MQAASTFEQHVVSFTEVMKLRSYTPATIRSYLASLRGFLAYLITAGITDVLEVDGATIRNYTLWLQRQKYAGWTVLTRLQAVRSFFDHLESRQALLLNPCAGQPAPKVPCRLPKWVLTLDEARHLLEAPVWPSSVRVRNRAILEVFYSSGIRLAEMEHLKTADVDTCNGFLRVNNGKGAKDRVVPMGNNASSWVRRYIDECRSCWISSQPNQEALWLSSYPPHGVLQSQAIAVMVKLHARAARMARPVTPHVWRHTCATHLMASGANVAYVQRLLGHSSLRTTQNYLRATIPEIKATHAQAHPRNQTTAP